MAEWDDAPIVGKGQGLGSAAPVAEASGNPWDAAPVVGPSPRARAVVSANDNGDEAAKALKISKSTGIPAPVVASDIPSYDAHAKEQAAVKAVENPAIAAYVNSHPMAAKVSGDDYPMLDEVSQYIQNLQQDKINGKAQVGLVQGIPEIVGMLGSAPGREKLYNALSELPHALSEGILDFFKTPGQVLSGETNLSTPQGLDKGISMGIGLALGGSDIRLGKVPTAPGTVGFDDFMSTLRGMQTRAEMDAFLKSKAEANSPPGALLQIEKAKAGADALDGAVEAAQESKTKIRSPDMFEEFAAAHGDSMVHLPAETVAELYAKEGKVPAGGDGLLGFIPDLPAQMERGLETGGEISVPLSKYLANVDPSVHEGLREDVRLHDDGVTLTEAKEHEDSLGTTQISEPVLQSLHTHFPDAFPQEDFSPQKEVTKATPGVNAGRLAKLLGPKLYGEPTHMATVSVKEMMQNAFDAIKGHLEKGLIDKGKINIEMNRADRTITVTDNGSGMTPEVLGKQFLEIAGTNKETKNASGGLGIAKMLFLFGNKELKVTTTRDGYTSTMETTGDNLFASLNDPSLAPSIITRKATAKETHGTSVTVKVPEEFKDPSSGDMKKIEFDDYHRSHPVLESPLFNNIDVKFNGRQLNIGSTFPHEKYTQFANVTFDWGTAHIYVTKDKKDMWSENTSVLSNGLMQFKYKIQKNPAEAFGDSIPRHFIVDVSPKVLPEDSGYPFDLNRQQFTRQAKDDFSKIFGYISKLYNQLDFMNESKSWGDIQYLSRGEDGKVISEQSKPLEPPVPATATAASAINEGDQVEIKDGKLTVNGRLIPELSKKDLEGVQLKIDELKFNQDEINPDKPILHDNIDIYENGTTQSLVKIAREKFGDRFDSYVFEIGDAFRELRDFVSEVMDYPNLRKEGIGISFDKEYRGVSIKIPFDGMFINPAAPKYTDPVRAGVGMVGTMIHELAHHKVRSHNAEFPAEMQDIQIALDDMQLVMSEASMSEGGLDLLALKKRVVKTVKDHHDILEWLNAKIDAPGTTTRGQQFKSAGNYQARDAGAVGDVEGAGEGQDLRPSAQAIEGEQGPSGLSGEAENGLEGAATADSILVNQQRASLYLKKLFADAKAVGLTDSEFKKYSDKIQLANADLIKKSIERDVARRTSADWKAKEAKARAEIEAQLAVTGPYAAQKYLKENKLELTSANADMLAPLFGYDTGAALIKGMENLPEVKSAIDGAVKELMEARYGNRRSNIAQEARELALSDDWHGILVDEVRILAKAAGVEPALSKDELVKWSKDTFEQSKIIDAANWEKMRRAVEKGGREAEKALLKGDFLEAFKAKQRQMLAATVAKESIKLQKVIDGAEKKIDRFTSEETIKAIDQTHLEQIRAMLASVGIPQQYGPGELSSLRDFVAAAEGQIAAAPWLMERPPQLKDMTVEQFRAFVDTMKSMEHVGRLAMTVENARGKAELQNVIFDTKKELERFAFIDQPESGRTLKQWLDSSGRKIIGLHLLVERMLDYTDQFNPHGPLTEWLDRPLRDSNTKEIVLTEQVTKMLRALKPLTDASINELIDNIVIPDARMKSGLMQMDRGNLRQLMLNMGNEANIKKVIEGFNVPESSVWDLINANATAKDFQWVQGVWDVFAHLKPEADALQLRDTGVPVDSKVPRAIKNAHGEFAGGYYPIVYDRVNSDIQGHLADKNPLFAPTYVAATTPHGYTEAVTGYKGALDLTGGFMASRIQGMVHDIAFREAIRNANKLISNQEFRTAIMQKWGKEYSDLLPGWLRDIANSHTLDDNYAQGFVRAASVVRQNTISTLVAFNPGTFIKHGFSAAVMSAEQVGGKELLAAAKDIGLKGAAQSAKDLATRYGYTPDGNFMQAFRDALDQGERGENARKFIMDSSAVMRNRQRKYDDSIRGAVDAMNEAGYAKLLADGRQNAMLLGRMAVAFSDGMSAMPTWLAAYREAFLKGEAHADAVFIADKAVSRAHGSNFVGDQPFITRLPNSGVGELGRWFTPLYKFWNHRFNSYVQLAWDAAATVRGPNGEAPPEPGANAASIAKRIAGIMALIYIEENATAALDEDHHGLFTKVALATVRHFGGGIVGLRELTNGLAGGYEPSTGMLGVVTKETTKVAKDIARSTTPDAAVSKNWLVHSATTIGILTGVGGSQPGKTVSFLKDLASEQERPRSFNEYRQGLRTGHSQARKF